MPGEPQRFEGGGKNWDWYQPTWQNGNALSYPALSGSRVPINDLGSFNVAGDPTPKSSYLFNSTTALGGVKGTRKLEFGSDIAVGVDRTSKRSLKGSEELKTSQEAKGGFVGLEAEVSASESIGFDESSAESSAFTNESTQSSKAAFELSFPQMDQTKGYVAGSTFYYDDSGVAKVRHGVDLTGNQSGRDWWRQTYGQQQDLALNLPLATTTVFDKDELRYSEVKWSPSASRQKIRGFYVQQPQDPSKPAVSGQPFGSNPVAGKQMNFSVDIHNYSLIGSRRASATFLAVPTDDYGTKVVGEPIEIGESPIPAIQPQGMTAVTSPAWTAPKPPAGEDLQNWRVFVEIDSQGAEEIHPLREEDGEPCPTESIVGDGSNARPLTDPMLPGNQPETLACGQNNRGFGEVTVMADQPDVAAEPAPVGLDGAHLLTREGDLAQGPARATVGVPVEGVVHLDGADTSHRFHDVAVFEGPPENGKLVAGPRIEGVDVADGGHGTFRWQPKKAGRHVLHMVLTNEDGSTDEQQLTVEVSEAPDTPPEPPTPDPTPATLSVRPTSPVVAGRPTAYTATVREAGRTRDVTRQTRFAVAPQGRCRANVCTVTRAGASRVTATLGTTTGATTVTVRPARAQRLRVTPARKRVRPGVDVRYQVSTVDRFGNRVQDVTAQASYRIRGGGTCRADWCRSRVTGRHTVVIRYAGLTRKAVIVVRRR